MQEEVNAKTVALCVQGARITSSALKVAMRKFLQEMHKKDQVKQAEKAGQAKERGAAKERERQEKKKPHGKQTIKQLNAQGAQLTNIEITDNNIKSFDRIARKYGIDYSLKRDMQVNPPRYLVFFKAKDVDVMTAAFKEYAGVTLKEKDKQKQKESVRKKLQKKVQKNKSKQRQRVRVKQKVRNQAR